MFVSESKMSACWWGWIKSHPWCFYEMFIYLFMVNYGPTVSRTQKCSKIIRLNRIYIPGHGLVLGYIFSLVSTPETKSTQEKKTSFIFPERGHSGGYVLYLQQVVPWASLREGVWPGQTQRWTRPGHEADKRRQRGWGQRLCVTPSSFPSLHMLWRPMLQA